MKIKDIFDSEATEANLDLNEKMNDRGQITHNIEARTTTEANQEIQEAFYGNKHQDQLASTYIINNTPAIKITRDDK